MRARSQMLSTQRHGSNRCLPYPGQRLPDDYSRSVHAEHPGVDVLLFLTDVSMQSNGNARYRKNCTQEGDIMYTTPWSRRCCCRWQARFTAMSSPQRRGVRKSELNFARAPKNTDQATIIEVLRRLNSDDRYRHSSTASVQTTPDVPPGVDQPCECCEVYP